MTRTGRNCRHLHGSCDTEGTGSAAIFTEVVMGLWYVRYWHYFVGSFVTDVMRDTNLTEFIIRTG